MPMVCAGDTYALGWGILMPQAAAGTKPLDAMVDINYVNNLFARGCFRPGLIGY